MATITEFSPIPAPTSEIWNPNFEKGLFFAFWGYHLEWLQDLGWEDAQRVEPYEMPEESSSHRTIDRLREYIDLTGKVNAHFGLTSSDVEDNVRRCQVMHSLARICHLAAEWSMNFRGQFSEEDLAMREPAFTHWQLAGEFSFQLRVDSWLEPIDSAIHHCPRLCGKYLGGAIGDFDELVQLCRHLDLAADPLLIQKSFPWEKLQLREPWNKSPIQSADYIDESFAIAWVCRLAALLHKVAMDMRFLQSHNRLYEVRPDNSHGSSSIPHKKNPQRWEKVCSITRTLLPAHTEIMEVIAHNGCERTLDTNWQLKNCLQQSFSRMEYALMTALEIHTRLGVRLQLDQENLNNQRRVKTTHILLGGQTRVEQFPQLSK